MSTEIVQKLDEALKGIKLAQEVADRNADRINALDQQQIKKINEDVTGALQQITDIQAKQKSLEEMSKNLEKIACRIPIAGDNQSVEKEKLAKSEFTNYLRKKSELSDKTKEYIADKLIEKSFIAADKNFLEYIKKDLVSGVNPSGGYFIRPEISNTIITRIFETSPVRNLATVTTTNTKTLEMLIDDEQAASGGWVGETAPRPVTGTPEIGMLEIHVHEQYAQPKATQNMLDDAGFDIENWLQQKITDIFTREENNTFVVGDGANKPRGFLTYDPWTTPGIYERGKIEQINSGSAGHFTADGIKKLKNSMIEDYQANAVFGIKREAFEEIITLKDGTGAYLLQPESIRIGDPQILLGKQVVFMHDMPAIAGNSLSLVYADFSRGYTIVDRLGIRVVRDEFTVKPYMLFYTIKRVGGAVTNYQAIKIQKLAV